MEDVVNNLARELAEAIGTAVAKDSQVEECREKARAAGYEMRVSLEAEIGFGNRSHSQALAKAATPNTHEEVSQNGLDITANDRRFLRSLRIAAEAVNQKVE
mgnify:CR=1 FL=1